MMVGENDKMKEKRVKINEWIDGWTMDEWINCIEG